MAKRVNRIKSINHEISQLDMLKKPQAKCNTGQCTHVIQHAT